MDRPETALDGPKEFDENFPDCAAFQDGSVLCAYVEYEGGRPVDEAAALAGSFDPIEFDGNGDRVMLGRRADGQWRGSIPVTDGGRDVSRPVVTGLSDGGSVVLWTG